LLLNVGQNLRHNVQIVAYVTRRSPLRVPSEGHGIGQSDVKCLVPTACDCRYYWNGMTGIAANKPCLASNANSAKDPPF
jgi:hypothetical protein